MDRSFLSDKELIKTSRAFVCIRTATYEDKQEAEDVRQGENKVVVEKVDSVVDKIDDQTKDSQKVTMKNRASKTNQYK